MEVEVSGDGCVCVCVCWVDGGGEACGWDVRCTDDVAVFRCFLSVLQLWLGLVEFVNLLCLFVYAFLLMFFLFLSVSVFSVVVC